MNHPHLIVTVSAIPELVILERKADRNMQEIRYTLDSLNAMGAEQAARTVGSDILGLMSYWYSNEFYPYRHIRFENKFEEEFDIVTSLVSRSFQKKTKMHLATIQAIIDDILLASPQMEKSESIKNWPLLREQIEKFMD